MKYISAREAAEKWGISQRRVGVLILSKAAQESKWVPKEVANAIDEDVMIIPLQIDDEPLTDQFDFLIGRKQRIDAYHRLSDALKELVGRVTTL